MSSHMAASSFLRLSSISSYGYTTVSLSMHPLMDT
jgi:hypothetical protein